MGIKSLWFVALLNVASLAFGQSFEVASLQEIYKGNIGETLKAPLRIKNISDKAQLLIVRKLSSQIGSTQKNYFCRDGNCLDQKVEDFTIKLEPGETLNTLEVALEGGLVPGPSSIRYVILNKFYPYHNQEIEINFLVEEGPEEKQSLYQSKFITLHDVSPNPITVDDYATVNYELNSDRVKATLQIHNLLGNVIGQYDLPPYEVSVRLKVDNLTAGIYLYTLRINNENVMTRKLIVKR